MKSGGHLDNAQETWKPMSLAHRKCLQRRRQKVNYTLLGCWSNTRTLPGRAQESGRAMLQSCARLLRGGSATCLRSAQCRFSVAHDGLPYRHRDFSLPNATWSRNTQQLYDKFLELCKNGTWRRIPSYNATVHHIEGNPPAEREKRLFTRNIDQDGVGFEYSMFYNKAENRMICIFQPGPYLEGPPGYTHGGCIATIIDSTVGAGAIYNFGNVMTANLNINYKNPIPLGSTVIVDSQLEKVEGRKVYLRCQIRSHNDLIVHTEATGLFIKLDPDETECRRE